MSRIKLHGWNKKARTMLRFIKPGDIFCFKLDDGKYCFGRIISKIVTGHVAEIFDYISSIPEVSEEEILNSKRLVEPIILDSYTLFDKKLEGEWRIIGSQNDYIPKDVSNIYFSYGVANSCKKVDIYDNETSITELESKGIPRLSPRSDLYIRELVINALD
ncbi:putative cytoplasmic protein [Yersinia aldovae]|uniref:immunity 26/phosphotriesterase HocA family protein n=1 Tax=Yersinia aldovae TaxID=29483 RepID=UPI0005E2FD52|nr:immunity 26/phosphotriesterase HocA family protein [Yersinia aldovae]CNH96702.1 putative cytoplasmic protein [Yersinia aldovae]